MIRRAMLCASGVLGLAGVVAIGVHSPTPAQAVSDPVITAGTATITFESQTPGTVLSNEYQNAGFATGDVTYQNGGVIFGPTANFNGPQPTVISGSASPDHTQAIQAGPYCEPPHKRLGSGRAGLTQLSKFGCLMFAGRFPYAKQHVSIKLLDTVATSSQSAVELDGLDAAGNIVATADATLQGATPPTTLSINTGAPQIVFFEVFRDNGGSSVSLTADDLSFDLPASPPPANFVMANAFTFQAPGPGGVLQGGSATYSVNVTRFNNPTGTINLSVDPNTLPAGVTAQVSPAQIGGIFGGSATVTLTAASNAPEQHGVTVSVIGTPSAVPDAGPNAKNVTFTTDVWAINVYQLQINGVEINQVAQYLNIPSRFDGASVDYAASGGVKLVAGRKTIVRVWVTNARPVPLGGLPAPTVLLYGSDANGKPLPGSPLQADSGPGTIPSNHGPALSLAERAGDTAFDFTLPAAKPDADGWGPAHRGWPYGKISLQVVVIPDTSDPRYVECTGGTCGGSFDQLGITNLPFQNMPTAYIQPVALPANGTQPNDPWTVLSAAYTGIPVGMSVSGFGGTIDISDLVNNGGNRGDALNRVQNWFDDNGYYKGNIYPVGMAGVDWGVTSSADGIKLSGGGNEPPASVVCGNCRAWTSVTHELGHGFGRLHASGACGGGSNGQVGESWPPDQQGYLDSIAIKPYSAQNVYFGHYQTFADAVDGKTHYYDYMSYCAGGDETHTWTSARGWDEIVNKYTYGAKPLGAPAASAFRIRLATPAPGPSLRVGAQITPLGAAVAWIKPGSTSPLPSAVQPDYTLQALDRNGAVLGTAPMVVATGHDDLPHNPTADTSLVGQVYVPDVAIVTQVRLLYKGGVITSRIRPAHAPRVRLVSPKSGSVGGGHPVIVRWIATDQDGLPLTAKVQWSANGGHSYTTVYIGANTGRATILARPFIRSKNGRIRIIVSDGFNQVSVVSRRLTSPGSPPALFILEPKRHARINDTQPIELAAFAAGDEGALTGRKITWYANRRLLGHGTVLGLMSLPPGTTFLRVTARSGNGQVASAIIPLRVITARPRFIKLGFLPVISRTARTVKLVVSSTVASILRVNGSRGFRVGLKPVTITIAIKPGKSLLLLKLVLTHGAATTKKTLPIRRV